MIIKQNKAKGFTLLELLIVIAILAILSVALVLILNPTETLRQGRDSQRISDLSTMKTALGLYMTTVKKPILDGQASPNSNTLCIGGTGDDTIFYSGGVTAAQTVEGTFTTGSTTGSTVDGTGWLPVDFSEISGGSPISNIPIDPINEVATATAPTSSDYVYRYACNTTNTSFEINAVLESDEFTPKMTSDGGDNVAFYEVGTNLNTLPTGTGF